MAANFVQKGDVLTVTSPTGGVSSGDPVLVGTVLGVALHDAVQGAELEVALEGIFTLPADNNLVMAQGERLFWDSTNGWVDKTSAAQFCVGIAAEAKTLTGTTVAVRLGYVGPSGA